MKDSIIEMLVLILVLMEYALGVLESKKNRGIAAVLILVLMEYALGVDVSKYAKLEYSKVLILVLMEYALGVCVEW